jgi:hypothetical protein
MLGAQEPPDDIWGNPYTLARYWSERLRWPSRDDQTLPDDALRELAVMSTLADWLRRWLPLQIHVALVHGADVHAVAGAAGVTAGEVLQLWEPWADREVDLWRTSNPDRRIGLNPDVAAQVRALLRCQPEPENRVQDASERSRW